MAVGDTAAGAEATGDSPLPDSAADRFIPSFSSLLSVGHLSLESIGFRIFLAVTSTPGTDRVCFKQSRNRLFR